MKVYAFVDYICIDQSYNPGEVCCKYLRSIVALCDVMVTPVVDPTCDTWEYGVWHNLFEEYPAPAWHSYRGRGWCRLEMLFNTRIPLVLQSVDRQAKFKAGLRFAHEQNRRPHLLYGSQERRQNTMFLSLPPTVNKWFELQNPVEGELTSEADRENIKRIVDEVLALYPHAGLNVGFKGDPNGRGRYVYDSGNIYEGEFKDGKRNGEGEMIYADSSRQSGIFVDDALVEQK
jgi:hypothetical protein